MTIGKYKVCLQSVELEWLRGIWGECWEMRPNLREEADHEGLTPSLGFGRVGSKRILRGRTGIVVMYKINFVSKIIITTIN